MLRLLRELETAATLERRDALRGIGLATHGAGGWLPPRQSDSAARWRPGCERSRPRELTKIREGTR